MMVDDHDCLDWKTLRGCRKYKVALADVSKIGDNTAKEEELLEK